MTKRQIKLKETPESSLIACNLLSTYTVSSVAQIYRAHDDVHDMDPRMPMSHATQVTQHAVDLAAMDRGIEQREREKLQQGKTKKHSEKICNKHVSKTRESDSSGLREQQITWWYLSLTQIILSGTGQLLVFLQPFIFPLTTMLLLLSAVRVVTSPSCGYTLRKNNLPLCFPTTENTLCRVPIVRGFFDCLEKSSSRAKTQLQLPEPEALTEPMTHLVDIIASTCHKDFELLLLHLVGELGLVEFQIKRQFTESIGQYRSDIDELSLNFSELELRTHVTGGMILERMMYVMLNIDLIRSQFLGILGPFWRLLGFSTPTADEYVALWLDFFEYVSRKTETLRIFGEALSKEFILLEAQATELSEALIEEQRRLEDRLRRQYKPSKKTAEKELADPITVLSNTQQACVYGLKIVNHIRQPLDAMAAESELLQYQLERIQSSIAQKPLSNFVDARKLTRQIEKIASVDRECTANYEARSLSLKRQWDAIRELPSLSALGPVSPAMFATSK